MGRVSAFGPKPLLSLAGSPDDPVPVGQRVADAARRLVNSDLGVYVETEAWRSPNPSIAGNAIPGRTQLGVRNQAKCNLFVLDALSMAGVNVPLTNGRYPLALDVAEFAKAGGPLVPVDITRLRTLQTGKTQATDEFDRQVDAALALAKPDAKGKRSFNAWASEAPYFRANREKIEALLRQARPGDVLVEKHHENYRANGAHMFLVLSNTFEQNGKVECAEANDKGAKIIHVVPQPFLRADALYLLRPAERV